MPDRLYNLIVNTSYVLLIFSAFIYDKSPAGANVLSIILATLGAVGLFLCLIDFLIGPE